jgi:hypothetical protein
MSATNSIDGAEAAVKDLQKAGFGRKKLSILGKEYHTEKRVIGYDSAGERMKYWGKMGAFGEASGVSWRAPRSL